MFFYLEGKNILHTSFVTKNFFLCIFFLKEIDYFFVINFQELPNIGARVMNPPGGCIAQVEAVGEKVIDPKSLRDRPVGHPCSRYTSTSLYIFRCQTKIHFSGHLVVRDIR
uniref:Uncharacterized protein n=1 Tax=Cacopsylla melanoneura TaxID=428564 RepID=A0A8D8URX7_9HEMI